MNNAARFTAGMVALVSLFMVTAAVRGDDPIDFQQQILPILSDRCFACHGPDKNSRQADMRLDQRDELLSHVTPGKADASELWSRISSVDDDELMPPPESKLSLTADEKTLIRRWIDEGALWNRHWSLEPLPDFVTVPDVSDSDWAAGDLDRFVLARLQAAGKKPAESAARWRWLRRVTLDLTGLPPTSGEIEAFEQDHSPQAWEKVVDRLLASPRFGEHLAVSWLDAARYADSYGYQSDLLSPTWPWRDWLIGAINDNMPYDQFIAWQLAGDLLPDATTDQILATAFNRLHRMTNEGGSLESEWRTEYVADRVNTLGTAVLGMTLECARCHDHKFDPITQQDYYNLFAFFNSIDEWGMYHDSSRVPTPSLLLPDADQQAAIDAARRQWQAANKAVTEYRQSQRDRWTDANTETSGRVTMIGPPAAHFPLDTIEDQKWLANAVDESNPGNTTPANQVVSGQFGNGLLLTGDDVVEFPYVKTGLQPWERFSVSFWIRIPQELPNAVLLYHQGGTDVGFFGTELSLNHGRLQFLMARFWPGNAWAVETIDPLPDGQWVHVTAVNQANGSANGLQIFVNGDSATRILQDQLTKRPDPPGSGFSLGARFRSTGFAGGIVDDVQYFDRPLSPVEIGLLRDGLESADRDRFSDWELAEHELAGDPQYETLTRQRADSVKQLLDVRTGVLEVPVMRESGQPQPAWVLARGQYDAPRTDNNRAVRRGPGSLPPMAADLPRNRRGLAQWLAHPDHPLTSRVAVNRLWQNFFESGLVPTLNDFGVQGQQPSHPQLLDWLARDFVDHGWDIKRLCKQIALSSTYRQDSTVAVDDWTSDPHNTLLARGPARRLTAEMIRDLALSAAGLLNEDMGGPPVSPYQPGNLWQEDNSMTPAWQQSVGRQLYRRSVYTVWKRTAPIPNMLLFDAAGREVCSVRRTTTNTPLQALVLLNDIQFVEAARVLAERALRDHGPACDDAITMMFVLLAGRKPEIRETAVLRELYHEQQAFYQSRPDEADRLRAVGEHPRDPDLSSPEVAAMTIVAQTILNSDAAVWRR